MTAVTSSTHVKGVQSAPATASGQGAASRGAGANERGGAAALARAEAALAKAQQAAERAGSILGEARSLLARPSGEEAPGRPTRWAEIDRRLGQVALVAPPATFLSADQATMALPADEAGPGAAAPAEGAEMAAVVAAAAPGLGLGGRPPLDSRDPEIGAAQARIEGMVERTRRYAQSARVLQQELAQRRLVIDAAGAAIGEGGLSADAARRRSVELAALLSRQGVGITNAGVGRLRAPPA